MTDSFGGVSAAMAMANLAVAFGGCPHRDVVPVELLDGGDVVAWLCPACDTRLPAEWRTKPKLVDPDEIRAANGELHNGHTAVACPKRVEVTRMADPCPRYLHGGCEPEANDGNG